MGAVDGVGGARQRCGTQGGLVHARPAVHQAAVVPLQHFIPGQQVMAEGDRLGGLQVSEAGHDGVGVGGGQFNRTLLQAGQFRGDQVNGAAQVKPYVCGHLVVTGATGMQLLAGYADELGEPGFDVHVHIFQLY